MRRIIAFSMIFVSFFAGWNWMLYQGSIHRSHISEEVGSVVVSIERGQNLQQIINTLDSSGVVEGKWFEWLVRIDGSANKIQAGEYEFSPGLTPVQILNFLVKGKVNQYAITIIEGQTFKEILAELHQHPAIIKTLPEKATMADYMKLTQIPEKHMEGLLMPETYFFVKNTSDVELIKRAYRAMQAFINTAWAKREKHEKLSTVYDALILASIVEKETGAAFERKKIAGLFLKRLDIGMKLQTDPTVIYGMGDEYKGDIRYKDLRTDTPYNTYTRYHLPPTPIAMPGKASIDAVLHPDQTDSLYFVSKGDGTHVFSKTLKEHNKAVDQYQRNR